ncbi:MAG: hypothetical protein ACRDL6_11495 [Solirubrobacterales bacterium]
MILITSLCALAVPLVAASGAQAHVYMCTVEGVAGPITPDPSSGAATGVESVLTDLMDNGGMSEGDSLTEAVGGDPLTDTDNGIRRPNAGWEDGIYEFHTPDAPETNLSRCLTVDGGVTGLFLADIDSAGAYDNTVCGTGEAVDRGPANVTTVYLGPPRVNIVDADYVVKFVAGNGPIQISRAETATGHVLTGDGMIHITPGAPGNCVDSDVTQFEVTGAFTLQGP